MHAQLSTYETYYTIIAFPLRSSMPSYMLHFDAVYSCCIDYENIKLVTGVVMNRVGNFFKDQFIYTICSVSLGTLLIVTSVASE